jgi:Lon protease-like protein
MTQLPMFPLGSVLFPRAILPLHVFEPRYRALVEHVLRHEPEFGVVLIERGAEVGGGDTRFAVGTVARIVEVGRTDDGRFVLATVGTRRIRVVEWLADDPFPLATVEALVDESEEADVHTLVDGALAALERVYSLLAALGEGPEEIEFTLSDDPVTASYQAAALAPVGSLDAQRVLEIDGLGARLETVSQLLFDQAELLEARLGGAG